MGLYEPQGGVMTGRELLAELARRQQDLDKKVVIEGCDCINPGKKVDWDSLPDVIFIRASL
jgi:hypothetical protein